MSLVNVKRFRVPRLVVEETEKALRRVGKGGYECFVLWSGAITRETFDVLAYHLPRQTSSKLRGGVSVRVDSAELHRLNRWLFDNGQMLGIQVHSHPAVAFHSDTDDTYPIVTTLGGLSIVVPYFCRNGLQSVGVETYRLHPTGWTHLPSAVAKTLLEIG